MLGTPAPAGSALPGTRELPTHLENLEGGQNNCTRRGCNGTEDAAVAVGDVDRFPHDRRVVGQVCDGEDSAASMGGRGRVDGRLAFVEKVGTIPRDFLEEVGVTLAVASVALDRKSVV